VKIQIALEIFTKSVIKKKKEKEKRIRGLGTASFA